MKDLYQEKLQEEYRKLVYLQNSKEFSKYATIRYYDEMSGRLSSVFVSPQNNRLPEEYVVDFRMPVFDKNGELRKNWHGQVKIKVSKSVLNTGKENTPPQVRFYCTFLPLNNHFEVHKIDYDHAWNISKNKGLWYFIISLGALINQDDIVMASGHCFNQKAYEHWLSRNKKPVTNIHWPLDLQKTSIKA